METLPVQPNINQDGVDNISSYSHAQQPQPQAPNLPTSHSQPELVTQKKDKKPYIALIILLIVVLTLFALYKFFGRSNSSIISPQDWQNITQQASDSHLLHYLRHQLSPDSKTVAQTDSEVEEFYRKSHRYTGLPRISGSSQVLGIDTNNDLQPMQLTSSLLKARLSGEVFSEESQKNEKYEFFISNVTASDLSSGKGVADFLINGRIGELALGNPDFDALRISLISTGPTHSYILAEIDDIFLIVLDRLIYGKPAESETPGLVSARYDDIYPYFFQYVELEHDLEEPVQKEKLPDDFLEYIENYSQYTFDNFQQTIGNLENYTQEKSSYKDIMAGESIIRVETQVSSLKFFTQVSNFLKTNHDYEKQYKQLAEKYCFETSDYQDYCDQFFPSIDLNKKEIDAILLLVPLFNFERFDLIVDETNLNLIGIDLKISLATSFFSFIQEIDDSIEGLHDLKSLSFELAYREMPKQVVNEITTPSSYVSFLPDNIEIVNNVELIDSESEILANRLFQINKTFVQEIWLSDLQEMSEIKSRHCQEKWEPHFCLNIGADWKNDGDEWLEIKKRLSESEYQPEEYEPGLDFGYGEHGLYDYKLEFSYPSERFSLSGPYASLTIDNHPSNTASNVCEDDQFEPRYADIYIAGMDYRVYTNKSYEESFFKEEAEENQRLSLDVCYLNPSGSYSHISPLAKRIFVNSSVMTYDQIIQKIVPILESIEVSDSQSLDLDQDYTLEWKLSNQRYEQYALGNAENDPNACEIGFFFDQNSYSRDHENIKLDFGIDREFSRLLVEEGVAYCQTSENYSYCLKCVGGKSEWTELEDCKGLSCNP